MKYGIIDFETNTHEIGDVIECFVEKVEIQKEEIKPLGSFHRYYESSYPMNRRAFEVHGLSPHEIKRKREEQSEDYPRLFIEDPEFEDFFSDVDVIVAHNLSFEKRHINGRVNVPYEICTMKDNRHYVQALNKNGAVKNPNLGETCSYYGKTFDPNSHHGAKYDTKITLDILKEMINRGHKKIPKENILSLLGEKSIEKTGKSIARNGR